MLVPVEQKIYEQRIHNRLSTYASLVEAPSHHPFQRRKGLRRDSDARSGSTTQL